MPRCKAVITTADGTTERCAAETAKHEKHGCCYYHEKVFDGLCSPVEYDDEAVTESYDKVIEVRSGDEVRRFG